MSSLAFFSTDFMGLLSLGATQELGDNMEDSAAKLRPPNDFLKARAPLRTTALRAGVATVSDCYMIEEGESAFLSRLVTCLCSRLPWSESKM